MLRARAFTRCTHRCYLWPLAQLTPAIPTILGVGGAKIPTLWQWRQWQHIATQSGSFCQILPTGEAAATVTCAVCVLLGLVRHAPRRVGLRLGRATDFTLNGRPLQPKSFKMHLFLVKQIVTNCGHLTPRF